MDNVIKFYQPFFIPIKYLNNAKQPTLLTAIAFKPRLLTKALYARTLRL